MGKESFLIYKSFYEPIKNLTREKKGILLEAIFAFNIDETTIDMPDDVKICFEFFKNQFRLDEEKYKTKCDKNKENINIRWDKKHTNVYERIRTHTKHTYNDNENDKDKEKEKEKNKNVPSGTDSDSFFESLWNQYPRREGKKEALRHYKASVKSEREKQDIQIALENYKVKIEKEKIETRFIKMGSTWFNNWNDYINYTPPEQRKNNASTQDDDRRIIRRMPF